MAITRRQFLHRSGLLAAGGLLAPGFLPRPFLRAARADTMATLDRYFVSIFLNGGNDGLNTVTPLDNGSIGALRTAYQAARQSGAGGLRLEYSDLLPLAIGNDPGTATPLALHPGLAGLKNLYDLGKVAVVQGCGYPVPNLSHDASTRKWQTATPLGALPAQGWIGRYMADNYGTLEIPAVTIARSIAGELKQTSTSVLGIDRLENFGFPYDTANASDNGAKDTALSAMYAEAQLSDHPMLKRVGDIGSSTYEATKDYPQLHNAYRTARSSWYDQYSVNATGMKRRLRDVAKYIYGTINGDIDSRIFQLANGGYDTHSNQGAAAPTDGHYLRHREVAEAVEIFYNDIADMGIANKVCILIWSEFGRRVEQNANNGTDHGTQAPMFVIGGSVQGNVYGNHPDINVGSLSGGNTVYSQAPGNPYRSTDFRDVYGTLLKHWFNVSDPSIFLPLDDDSLNPNQYWRSANFDLGFLV